MSSTAIQGPDDVDGAIRKGVSDIIQNDPMVRGNLVVLKMLASDPDIKSAAQVLRAADLENYRGLLSRIEGAPQNAAKSRERAQILFGTNQWLQKHIRLQSWLGTATAGIEGLDTSGESEFMKEVGSLAALYRTKASQSGEAIQAVKSQAEGARLAAASGQIVRLTLADRDALVSLLEDLARNSALEQDRRFAILLDENLTGIYRATAVRVSEGDFQISLFLAGSEFSEQPVISWRTDLRSDRGQTAAGLTAQGLALLTRETQAQTDHALVAPVTADPGAALQPTVHILSVAHLAGYSEQAAVAQFSYLLQAAAGFRASRADRSRDSFVLEDAKTLNPTLLAAIRSQVESAKAAGYVLTAPLPETSGGQSVRYANAEAGDGTVRSASELRIPVAGFGEHSVLAWYRAFGLGSASAQFAAPYRIADGFQMDAAATDGSLAPLADFYKKHTRSGSTLTPAEFLQILLGQKAPEPSQALYLPLLENAGLQVLLQGARMALRETLRSA